MSALDGIRIIELAEGVSGEYCGKLLADFGAEVVKIERPFRGSPTRSMAPVIGDGDDVERSGLFAYLATGKKSVVLDLESPEGRETLHQLLDTADAVIDDHPAAWTERAGLSPDDAHRRHPSVVFCSITPYGATAPAQWQHAQSLTVFHGSGWGFHTPSDADPDRPPLKGPGRFLADYEAALDAALCLVSALFSRSYTGAGEYVDLSKQAVLVSRTDCVLGRFVAGEIAPEGGRADYDMQGPATFFACADGYVYLFAINGRHWAGIETLLGDPGWLREFDDDWLEFGVTPEKVALFRRGFADWVRREPKEAVSERAQKLGVPLVPLNDVADLHASPQYRHRGFFQRVTHPVLGPISHPTVPYRLGASPARITAPAPLLGADTAEVLADLPRARRAPVTVRSSRPRTPLRARGGPLQGVRVVELTKVWAGPYAGKLLAFLGAEVIKVESADNPDEMRAYGGTDIDHAPFFLSINPEILSADIDIKSRAGTETLRALIAESDVVINSLRPGAMERGGLGYEQLRAVKSDIISVSIKMWGNDGPLGYQTGYAPCFAALAGLAALVGYEDGTPLGANTRYGDSTVGAAAAFAAVVALVHRERTGEGQFVDVSAVETLSSMIGDRLVEASLTGRGLVPDGNSHPDLAPHGCYRCADDRWIALAVDGDDQWRRLCTAVGDPGLASDRRFARHADRLAGSAALDDRLSLLTRGHFAEELAGRLRAAGVAAATSAGAEAVIGDALLWDRGFYRFVSDRVEGQRPVLGAPWILSRAPARIECGAPALGEHTGYVLDTVLGGGGSRRGDPVSGDAE